MIRVVHRFEDDNFVTRFECAEECAGERLGCTCSYEHLGIGVECQPPASSAGCGIVNNALQKIIDRQFEGTGSHINTMHKDLTISMDLGTELGVPLHTAAAAMQIFHAGRSKYPQGDNWVCTRVIEEITGAELHREKAVRS